MRCELPTRMMLLSCLLAILAAWPAIGAITALKVATTDDDEAYPSVSGGTVVWQVFNSRYGDWDIVGADVSNGTPTGEFTIADFNGDDLYPVIDGNDVVWQNRPSKNSDADVHAARLSNRQIAARFAVSSTGADESLPSVSNGVAVWQHRFADASDWDVLGARLSGKDNPEPFFVAGGIDVDELFPCISGNLVVWQLRASDMPSPYAYGADISDSNSPRTFYTAMALGEDQMPGLSEGWLVGRQTDGVGKVTVDNLFDPFNPEGISSSGLTANPRIHKHIVVWQDQSNGTWDIRGYNLITKQEFVVTNLKMSQQVNPAVYVDTKAKRALIVWQDNRDESWDIYAAVVDGPEVADEAGDS